MTDPTAPGPDETRVRQLLVKNGVGPDARPAPAIPPKPAERPRDWLDEILNDTVPTAPPQSEATTPVKDADEDTEPAPVAAPAAIAPKKTRKPKARVTKRRPGRGKRHDPAAARSAWDTRPPAPRQSLVEAWDRVPYRLKWLAYHASAAYLGWSVGIVGYATYVTAWIARTGFVGPQAIFWYVVGALLLVLYQCTRGWRLPVAWLATVPASSVVVGVLLYGTPHQ